MLSPRRSTLFGAGSYLSKEQPHPPSPSGAAASPPSSPIPKDGSRPTDVLTNRLHEIKRITKSLVAYMEGIANAHLTHAATLLKLSSASIIQTPLAESSLFLPSPPAPGGCTGWADLLAQIKESNKSVAEEHSELAKTVNKSVVIPLKKLRVDIKAHIAAMEKEVSKLAEVVIKERETSLHHVSALARSVIPPPSTPDSALPPPVSEDACLLKYTAEQQVKVQTARENELLAVVLSWQEKTEALEQSVWERVAAAWRVWEETNSNLLLGNQQRSVLLSANVDSLPLDAEWNHFSKLNHLIPKGTQPASLEDLEYPGRDNPMARPVRQGILERQKRFVKTWKSAFFVLTPSGNLHEYASNDVPMNRPAVSLHLPACTLGPMPEPIGRQLEAMFTIEGPDSRNVFRAKSWEELSNWWAEIEKFTKVAPIPPASPLIVDDEHDSGDIGSAHKAVPPLPVDAERSESPALPETPSSPPPLPARPSSPPPLPARATPSLPTSPGHDLGVHSASPPLSPASPPTSPPILTETPDSPSFSNVELPTPTAPTEAETDESGHTL